MIKKVVVRGGHNFACPGASGIIDETTEDRKVKSSVIKYLRLGGCTVIDGTPGNCSENADLNFGTNTANNNHADLFLPIHFNKCYNSYNGKIGSEVWLNPNNSTSVAIGKRIMSKLIGLGFKDRGLKDGVNSEHLHDIKASNMPAILCEICFVEATEDVALYKKLGFDAIGKAIAEGILDKKIGTSTTITPVSTEMYRVRLSWDNEKSQIGCESDYYKAKDIANLHPGYYVYNSKGKNLYTLAVVKPVVKPAPVVNTKVLFRVIAGSFDNESGADNQIALLKKLGVESFKTQK